VRLEVLIVVTMETRTAVFWDMTPCSLADGCQHFGGIRLVHFHLRRWSPICTFVGTSNLTWFTVVCIFFSGETFWKRMVVFDLSFVQGRTDVGQNEFRFTTFRVYSLLPCRQGQDICLYCTTSRPALGPTQPHPWVRRVTRLELKANNLPPSGAELRVR
jgi:hypothetical protein